jgi:hypothetical protein
MLLGPILCLVASFPHPASSSDMALADAVRAAQAAGFTGIHLIEAVAIAQAESSGVTNEVTHDSNGTFDTGLWQINSVHKEYDSAKLKDPLYNAQAAYTLSKGGTDWSAWATYNNKRAQSEVGTAESAVQNVASTDPSVANVVPANFWTDLGKQELFGQLPGGAGVWNNLPGLPSLPGSGLVSGAEGALSTIGGAFARLSDPKFWLRVGEWLGAMVLIIIGLSLVFRRDITAGARGVAKAAVIA